MRILLTGASGYLGKNLIKKLSGKFDITALARNPESVPHHENLKTVVADLSKDDFVKSIPGYFDSIVHLAQANASFPEGATELFKVNLMSTQLLAEFARKTGAKSFIYASTGNVYTPSVEPLEEDAPCNSIEYYAMTKYSSEIILHNYSPYFAVIILRFFCIYGPGQVARLIPRIVDRVKNRQNVILVNGGQPKINPIYVDDCVSVVEKSINLKNSVTMNVGGDDIVSVKDIAEMVAKVQGTSVHFEMREDKIKRNLIGKNDRMKQILKLERLTSFAEGMKRILSE